MSVFLDCSAFSSLGGWTIDQQCMDSMHTAYLIASGPEGPVADAITEIDLPSTGNWRIWCRTRNWTAVWKRGHGAGRFQVAVDERVAANVLGTCSEEWGWEYAGSLSLSAGHHKIALRDLTGFLPRCQAIYITIDPNDVPPDEDFAAFRARFCDTVVHDSTTKYDLIVAGAGYAGICTAIAAARTGSKVLLLNDRGVTGGCNSSEIRVALGGGIFHEPYPNLGRIVNAVQPICAGAERTYPGEYYEDVRKSFIFQRERNCTLLAWMRVVRVERNSANPRRIDAVIARDVRTGVETRYHALLFADCTGDGAIVKRTNCELMYGRESREKFGESLAPDRADAMIMGHSVLWYSEVEPEVSAFPAIDWGLPFDEDKVYYKDSCIWEWETGQMRDQCRDIESIRDYGWMTAVANWSFLKNYSARKAEWAHKKLRWLSVLGGKREGVRAVGDYILTQNDIEQNIPHADATAAMSWNIDLHMPDPQNAERFDEPFCACAYHRGIAHEYPVPYRCLYARDLDNLFLGGRLVSVSHVAFALVRVMRTLGMLGEVVGMAATLCRKFGVSPRELGQTHFNELAAMMRDGVPNQPYHAYPVGIMENYHFHDKGFFRVSELDKADDDIRARVARLGVRHLADKK